MKKELGQTINRLRIARGFTQTDVALALGTSPGNVSRYETGANTPELPRLLELSELLGVSLSEMFAEAEGVPNPKASTEAHQIPLLANSGSMGGGSAVLDEDLVIGSLSLTKSWVGKYLPGISAPSKLRFIHACGESMSPTFNGGDILLVDTGVTTPDIDGIYVLEVRDELYIKRVSRRFSGQHEVTSDNPLVKTVDTLNGDHSVQVKGLVVWGWNGRKL